MAKQEQIQIQQRLRSLDDVFHRTIITLERLEVYLLNEKEKLPTTAIGTERDQHDDKKNVPTHNTLMSETQLQLSALYFQTKFDDKDLFEKSVKYFLKDLLEWYGGRINLSEYNAVDAYVLPIIVSLSRQIDGVADIMEVVRKYVAVLPTMADYTDEQKASAIKNGIESIILMQENMKNRPAPEEPVSFTVHKRGNAVDGYKRVMNAMLEMYSEEMPAMVIYKTIKNFLPEVANAVPSITEETISKKFQNN